MRFGRWQYSCNISWEITDSRPPHHYFLPLDSISDNHHRKPRPYLDQALLFAGIPFLSIDLTILPLLFIFCCIFKNTWSYSRSCNQCRIKFIYVYWFQESLKSFSKYPSQALLGFVFHQIRLTITNMQKQHSLPCIISQWLRASFNNIEQHKPAINVYCDEIWWWFIWL